MTPHGWVQGTLHPKSVILSNRPPGLLEGGNVVEKFNPTEIISVNRVLSWFPVLIFVYKFWQKMF